MRPSTRTTAAASAACCGPRILARVLFCSILFAFAANIAVAQQNINPATTSVQYAGTPNAANVVSNFTAPAGGLVLSGTAISLITGRPVRYLWVGDGTFGLCRVDPEIDAPGIHSINVNTCPFKLNGASITGGPLAFDSVNNFMYLTDIRASQGVFRLHYLPSGDNGNGILDFTNIFAMAGNPTAARFSGGQTGCQFPTNSTLATADIFGAANAVALAPDGSLWVGSKRTGAILRINSPATATSTGFGTCNDFVQMVATTPDNATGNGLAWLGHDLWGTDGTSPFVIANADTTCQALSSAPVTAPTCVGTNVFPNVGAANSTASDQYYPQLNGNNLYFGLGAPGNVVWEGNVSAGPAGQTEDLTFINQGQLIAAFPAFVTLGNVGAVVADYTDPANEIVFAGEDPSLVGALGAGRWFETCQGNPPALGAFNCPTPVATLAPGTPTVARATAGNASAIVSWSAAQSFQPVTSYTVRNSFASNAAPVADVIVNTAPSGFPPTTTTVGGLTNGVSYAFSVAATNGIGTSAFSPQSNTVTPPGIAVPGIPTSTQASAGDTAAFVTWAAPANIGGGPITSYTVTAIANNVVSAITSTVPGAANSAVIVGLTNGVSYTFSVHATNAGGNSLESTPSNAVIPAVSPVLLVTETGPLNFTISPTQLTFNVSITNTSILPVTNTTVTDLLLTGDGAFILLGQPSQGTCAVGGVGVTTLTCNLGTMAAGARVTLNVIVQVQGGGITNTVNVSALDNAAQVQTGSAAVTSVPPPPPSQSATTAVSVTGNAQVPNPNIGQAGNVVWTVSNTTQVAAPNVVFTNTIPAGMQLNSIALTINNGGAFICTFTPTGGLSVPCPGNFNTALGGTIQVTTPSLGGSTKNGAKPPQTLIMTVNMTPPAATPHGAVFHSTGTMTFGPGGIDTLPNSATVTITVR